MLGFVVLTNSAARECLNITIFVAGLVLVVLTLASVWGIEVKRGPKSEPQKIAACVVGLALICTSLLLQYPPPTIDQNEQGNVRRFMTGRWSVHHLVKSTGYEYDSILRFYDDDLYREDANGTSPLHTFGTCPLHTFGTWTVTPVSHDSFTVTVSLHYVGQYWTDTIIKLDRNSFRNKTQGYTAYRLSE